MKPVHDCVPNVAKISKVFQKVLNFFLDLKILSMLQTFFLIP